MATRDLKQLLCGLLLLACSAADQAPVGGETNWLLACEAPEDCAGEYDCLCGVCTTACDPGGDVCAPAGATCEAVSSFAGDVCAGTDEAAVCAALCIADADCTPLGARYACEQGRCVASTAEQMLPEGGEDGTEPDASDPMGCRGRRLEACDEECSTIYATPYSLRMRCQYDPRAISCGPLTDACPSEVSFAMSPGQPLHLTCVPDGLPTFEPDEVERTAPSWPTCSESTPPPSVPCGVLDCVQGLRCCDACGMGMCVPSGEPCPESCDYDPCADKACGDTCHVCDPADTGCFETQEVKTCNAAGICTGSDPMCGAATDTPCPPCPSSAQCVDGECVFESDGDGGVIVSPPLLTCATVLCAAGTRCCDECGRAQCLPNGEPCPTTCTYEPCADKACGDTCSLCDPLDTDCFETLEVKTCGRDGSCSGSPLACDVAGGFACGPASCDADSEYCLTVQSGLPGGMNSNTCASLEGKSCDDVGGSEQNGGCRLTLAAP